MAIAIGLGLVVGLILALTGSGGPIIAVPMLIFGLGWDVARAGPVALFAVGLAAALSAVIGLRAGIVRCRAAALMAAVIALVSVNAVTQRAFGLIFQRSPRRPRCSGACRPTGATTLPTRRPL